MPEVPKGLPERCTLILGPGGGLNSAITGAAINEQPEGVVSPHPSWCLLASPPKCVLVHVFLSLALLPRTAGLHELTPVHPRLAILWVVVREFYFMILLGWKFASPLLYPPRVWQVPGFRLPLFEPPEMSQALSVPSSNDQKWNSAPSPSSLVCHLATVPKWGWEQEKSLTLAPG